MPKLKEVKVTRNSMSWEDVKLNQMNRAVSISIPKRELDVFLSKGYKVSKVTVTFEKDKELDINKVIENDERK